MPPPGPDLTDQAVRDAQTSMRNRMLASSGRSSSFLTTGGTGQAAPTPNNTTKSGATALPWDYGLEQKPGGAAATPTSGFGGPLLKDVGGISTSKLKQYLGRSYANRARQQGAY
jgi:hypothetical protein